MAQPNRPVQIRPDFDTDCLWRDVRRRTISREASTDVQNEVRQRSGSVSEMQAGSAPTSPVGSGPTRRMSFSELVYNKLGFGQRGFSWGEGFYKQEGPRFGGRQDSSK